MKLSEIKTRLATLVKSYEPVAKRPILVEDKGNLVSQLETALQTQSLAVVIALASGEKKDSGTQKRGAWNDTFEVVIHRGQLDGDDVPAADEVLDDLLDVLDGADVKVGDSSKGTFTCLRYDLREGGDGTYARVLNVRLTRTKTTKP